MTKDGSTQKLISVQALRGLAALLVVMFHISSMFRLNGEPRSDALGAFWDRGFAGVDMFFVISGFIMVYVTRNLPQTVQAYQRFLWARLTRIWWRYPEIGIASTRLR